MIIQCRNLTQGLTGADVRDLQNEMTQLDNEVSTAEQQDSDFGQGMLTAIMQLQPALGLGQTIIGAATTATVIAGMIAGITYAVTSPTQAGLDGLAVQLVDKDVRGASLGRMARPMRATTIQYPMDWREKAPIGPRPDHRYEE
jgi:hypothetical protein